MFTAIQFNVNKTTINRLWRVTKNKLDAHLYILNGEPVDNPAINNRAINDLIHDIDFYESGRKLSGNNPKWDIPQLLEVVRAMPLTERQSILQLAKNLSIPYSTLHGMFKLGHFRWHTSALKPFLTEENKASGWLMHWKRSMGRLLVVLQWMVW